MTALQNMSCKPREGAPLSRTEAENLLREISGWTLNDTAKEISRTFRFENYYETLAFINALAWVAHREDHHPDLGVSYNRCTVHFSTHSVRGLSENDFICAAKIDALNGVD
jgi:4a-hydroxytetrahydrobiopterin dehydratase